MEFLRVYATAALPVFLAFAVIWWWMTTIAFSKFPERVARAAKPAPRPEAAEDEKWREAA